MRYNLPDEDDKFIYKEKCLVAKVLGINVNRIVIDVTHPTGESCIFINGVWNGYLDSDMYNFLLNGVDTYGEYSKWVGKWRDKK